MEYDVVIPMRNRGRKVYVSVRAWEGTENFPTVHERDKHGKELRDGGKYINLDRCDLKPWKETPKNLTAVRWKKQPNKIYYVIREYWENPLTAMLALRNRKGFPIKKVVADRINEWVYVSTKDLEGVE